MKTGLDILEGCLGTPTSGNSVYGGLSERRLEAIHAGRDTFHSLAGQVLVL
jgi:hypothetical protein